MAVMSTVSLSKLYSSLTPVKMTEWTFQLKFWLIAALPSTVVTVTEYGELDAAPLAMVPVIWPVPLSMLSPEGRPVAVNVGVPPVPSVRLMLRLTTSPGMLVWSSGLASSKSLTVQLIDWLTLMPALDCVAVTVTS